MLIVPVGRPGPSACLAGMAGTCFILLATAWSGAARFIDAAAPTMNEGSRALAGAPATEFEEGDQPQLDQLFRAQAPGLIRFFSRRTGDRDGAGDLVQEVFLRLLGARAAGSLRNPEAYLQRIARNLLIDSRRRNPGMNEHHVPFDDKLELAVPAEQAASLHERDLRARYERALADLTPRTREVFLLHRAQELSYKAICLKLGISLGTVEYHMGRALVHLDRTLSEE